MGMGPDGKYRPHFKLIIKICNQYVQVHTCNVHDPVFLQYLFAGIIFFAKESPFPTTIDSKRSSWPPSDQV